ncbi:uncharacterized protein LDX57_001404 [Aspergillus melleus]|uniref:uncharacterized protein n=1 Tax=Aspergillus melleus TaxID=138277 RepID=UPI001E8CFF55|nr:uncharacterized protein LDX57_001404 [Aspergillus melleus]KAH8423645.1 hypothetical protein LDX57_001404 [Aspergillus melleus]
MDRTINRTIHPFSYPRSTEEDASFSDQSGEFLTIQTDIQTTLLPGNPNRFGTTNPPLQTLSSDPEPRVLAKPWRPSDAHAHSWSEEDRKHELQARLLDVEKGVNAGFTETE